MNALIRRASVFRRSDALTVERTPTLGSTLTPRSLLGSEFGKTIRMVTMRDRLNRSSCSHLRLGFIRFWT